jgi:alkaline phosphatase D
MENRISRRTVFKAFGIIGAAAALPSDVSREGFARVERSGLELRYSNNPLNHGATSSWVKPNEVVVTSRMCPPTAARSLPVDGSIALFDQANGEQVGLRLVRAQNADDFRVRASFSNLDPTKEYRYDVIADEFGGVTLSGKTQSPQLRVRDPHFDKPRDYVRLAFVSCMEFTRGFWTSFQTIHESKPDAVFIIGDSIYADVEQLPIGGSYVRDDVMPYADDYELLLMKYLSCNDEDKIRLLVNSPGFFVPDDHEFRNNAQGGMFSQWRIMEDGCRAYSSVYASPEGVVENGFYRSIDFGQGTRVLLLDTRRFRDSSQATMLGVKQERWLMDELARAKSDNVTRTIIVSSVSFVSGSEKSVDSWSAYSRERQHIIDRIASLGLTNVSFVTGDLHRFFTGAIRLDPLNPTSEIIGYEFEGGAVSSSVTPTQHSGPNVLAYSKNSHGVMVADVFHNGAMETRWLLNDARRRNSVPVVGARFYNSPQSAYASPQISARVLDPKLVGNPGEISIVR